MRSPKRRPCRGAAYLAALAPLMVLPSSACSRADHSTLTVAPELATSEPASGEPAPHASGPSNANSASGSSPMPPVYALSSLVFGADNTTTYVSLLDSLGDQTIDFANAREFSGTSDLWVNDGHVFIADGETLTVTRYDVQPRSSSRTAA